MCPNCSFLQIWSHLVKESLMENLHFLCSVSTFALLKEQRTPDKNIYFPVKNGFSIRRLFWCICGSLLAHHRVIRNIPGILHLPKVFLKNSIVFWNHITCVVLRLYPVIVLSLSRDCTLRFLRGIQNISGCYAFT